MKYGMEGIHGDLVGSVGAQHCFSCLRGSCRGRRRLRSDTAAASGTFSAPPGQRVRRAQTAGWVLSIVGTVSIVDRYWDTEPLLAWRSGSCCAQRGQRSSQLGGCWAAQREAESCQTLSAPKCYRVNHIRDGRQFATPHYYRRTCLSQGIPTRAPRLLTGTRAWSRPFTTGRSRPRGCAGRRRVHVRGDAAIAAFNVLRTISEEMNVPIVDVSRRLIFREMPSQGKY